MCEASKFISLMFVCFAASRCMWDLCGVKKEVLIMESYYNVVRLDNMRFVLKSWFRFIETWSVSPDYV